MPMTEATKKKLLSSVQSVQDKMAKLVNGKMEGLSEDKAFYSSVLSAEEVDQHNKLVKEWDFLQASLKVFEDAKDRDRLLTETADLHTDDRTIHQKAKANAQAFEALLKVGQNKFTAQKVEFHGHPGQLAMHPPAIFKDETGKNVVQAFPAVYQKEESGLDYEACFRQAEMMKAGKSGMYDPSTGKKLEAAGSDPIITTDVPASIPDLVVDLYRYMITRNMVAMYCRTYQTPGLNDLPIQRRTTVPKATIIGNNSNYGQNMTIGDQQSNFSTLTLRAFKYAFISQYSYEAMMTVQPWSVMAQVAEDGGIGLANGFGEHVVDGSGGTSEPQGILTAVDADSTQEVTGPAAANAFTTTSAGRLFNVSVMTDFLTSMPIAYFNAPNKKLLMNLDSYGKIIGVTDTQGRPVLVPFLATEGVQGASPVRVPVILDQNMPNSAQNAIPFILGDFMGHAVRYAGGPRIEFSSEYGFANDLLSYKFVQYADAQQVDPNCFRGMVMA